MNKMSPKRVHLYSLLILAAGAALGAIGAISEIKLLAILGITLLIGDIVFSSLRIKNDKFKLRCNRRNCSRCGCPAPHGRPPYISR